MNTEWAVTKYKLVKLKYSLVSSEYIHKSKKRNTNTGNKGEG